MRALVTGAGGQLGRTLAGALAGALGVEPVIRGITLDELARSAPPLLRAVEPQARRRRGGDAALAGRGRAVSRYPAALRIRLDAGWSRATGCPTSLPPR